MKRWRSYRWETQEQYFTTEGKQFTNSINNLKPLPGKACFQNQCFYKCIVLCCLLNIVTLKPHFFYRSIKPNYIKFKERKQNPLFKKKHFTKKVSRFQRLCCLLGHYWICLHLLYIIFIHLADTFIKRYTFFIYILLFGLFNTGRLQTWALPDKREERRGSVQTSSNHCKLTKRERQRSSQRSQRCCRVHWRQHQNTGLPLCVHSDRQRDIHQVWGGQGSAEQESWPPA